MTGTLEKMGASSNARFRNTVGCICPSQTAGEEAAEKGVNKQKLYAVLFVVIIENDIISIDVTVCKVKETKNNKYIYKKNIITKNVVVEQKHSVKSLINDMLNGNFNRIQLPDIGTILGLIPGFGMGVVRKDYWPFPTPILSPFPIQDLVGCSITSCSSICPCWG